MVESVLVKVLHHQTLAATFAKVLYRQSAFAELDMAHAFDTVLVAAVVETLR
jgi:hypothetical protein